MGSWDCHCRFDEVDLREWSIFMYCYKLFMNGFMVTLQTWFFLVIWSKKNLHSSGSLLLQVKTTIFFVSINEWNIVVICHPKFGRNWVPTLQAGIIHVLMIKQQQCGSECWNGGPLTLASPTDPWWFQRPKVFRKSSPVNYFGGLLIVSKLFGRINHFHEPSASR